MSTFRFDEDNVGHQLARERRKYLWQGAWAIARGFIFWGVCFYLGWLWTSAHLA